jgi:hypothetical protein
MGSDFPGHDVMYLPHGRYSHLVQNGLSWCGLDRYGWLGTGTMDEYEKAERLPKCRNCLSRLRAVHPGFTWD